MARFKDLQLSYTVRKTLMNRWDPQKILPILSEAGRIALHHYERPVKELKSDLSIVTQADHEIEAYFETQFDQPASGSYVIGEETINNKDETYVRNSLSETCWIVDPIDGTSAYANHIPTWGISIGYAENGHIIHGAVYFPITHEVFITDGEEVRYGLELQAGKDLEPREWAPLPEERPGVNEGSVIAVTQGVAKGAGIRVVNPVQALGCAILPLSYLLLNRYIAYLGSLKLWDIAGVLPMLLRKRFTVELVDGSEIDGGISEDFYVLSAGHRNRWKFRKKIICAISAEAARYVLEAINS